MYNKKKYTTKELELAVKAVTSQKCSISRAAVMYGIPYGTVYNKFHGLHMGRVGSPPLLSPRTEEMLVKILAHLAEKGFVFRPAETIQIVQLYLESSEQENIFQNGKPTNRWYYGFMKRHKDKINNTNTAAENQAQKATQLEVEEFKDFFSKIKELYDTYEENEVYFVTKFNVSNLFKRSYIETKYF
jgi:hypothetical protein